MNASDVLAAVERAVCAHFGQDPSRASVCFVGVEPIEVLRFEPTPGERAYVSLGMSRHPMTDASDSVARAGGPRAELVLDVHDTSGSYAVWPQLAVLAASPAVEGVLYTPGMSVDLGQPVAPGSRCTGGVIAESALAAIETPLGPVAMLQVLPATSSELAWCRVHGAAALRERWSAQRIDLCDLARRTAALD
ncbi:MAG: Suppressor of fused domain protein [Pseudonocardiales bacterium]|nr:MAG: Suppressor of fused domain protein [Pseudonocardiales bacterium]